MNSAFTQALRGESSSTKIGDRIIGSVLRTDVIQSLREIQHRLVNPQRNPTCFINVSVDYAKSIEVFNPTGPQLKKEPKSLVYLVDKLDDDHRKTQLLSKFKTLGQNVIYAEFNNSSCDPNSLLKLKKIDFDHHKSHFRSALADQGSGSKRSFKANTPYQLRYDHAGFTILEGLQCVDRVVGHFEKLETLFGSNLWDYFKNSKAENAHLVDSFDSDTERPGTSASAYIKSNAFSKFRNVENLQDLILTGHKAFKSDLGELNKLVTNSLKKVKDPMLLTDLKECQTLLTDSLRDLDLAKKEFTSASALLSTSYKVIETFTKAQSTVGNTVKLLTPYEAQQYASPETLDQLFVEKMREIETPICNGLQIQQAVGKLGRVFSGDPESLKGKEAQLRTLFNTIQSELDPVLKQVYEDWLNANDEIEMQSDPFYPESIDIKLNSEGSAEENP